MQYNSLRNKNATRKSGPGTKKCQNHLKDNSGYLYFSPLLSSRWPNYHFMAKFDETAAYRDILDFGFANLQEKKKL